MHLKSQAKQKNQPVRLVGQREVAVSYEVLAGPSAAVVHSTALGVVGVLVVQAAVRGHVSLRVQRRLRGVQVVLRVHQVAVARFNFCCEFVRVKSSLNIKFKKLLTTFFKVQLVLVLLVY